MSEEWKEAKASSGDAWNGEGEIMGRYIGKQIDVGSNHSNMYFLMTDKGKVGVWGSAVLDSKFMEIPVGCEVRIEYLGTAEGKQGRHYKDYKVSYREAPMQEAVGLQRPDSWGAKDDNQPPVENYENLGL